MGLTQITTGGVDGNINIDSNTLKVDGTNNRVGIGTATAGRTLSVDGSIQVSNSTSGFGLGEGFEILHESSGSTYLLNRENAEIRFYTNNSERMRVDSSGKIGVGTSSPKEVVDARGAAVFSGDHATSQNAYGTAHGIMLSSTSNLASIKAVSNGSNDVAIRFIPLSSGSGSEAMRIDSSGRLGIGTTSPSNNLDILSTTSGATVSARVGSTATSGVNNANLIINNGGTGNATLRFDYESSTNRASIGVPQSTQALFFTTAGSERMRIDSSGNVGIGTSAPDTKVHVVGSLKVENTSGTGNAWTYYKNADRTYLVGVRGSGSDALSFYDLTADAERMRIDTSGRVGIGTSSPSFELQVTQSGSASEIAATSDVTSGTASRLLLGNSVGTARATFNLTGGGSELAYLGTEGNFPMYFQTNGAERMRIDSSGKIGIGTSSPQAKLHISDDNGRLRFTNTTGSGTAGIDYYANATERGYTRMDFSAGALAIGTNPAWPITFTTNTAERARIDSDGNFLVGKNTLSDTATGLSMRVGGVIAFEATVGSGASHCMMLNRQSDDGAFVKFRQANTLEGTITVSGSTVSYNGGHLARWSQLADGAERTEILRGSVLSNLDEMCEWGEEDNEQLNRMKISDVEGDVNVSGVFQDWDDNDDAYTNDFYCAMTGDFVIRIAQGTTVARGDLLMSAGDGTAKPQDDDIVRSKTIAKVTSTTVSTTYSDGSYCVPCVLMAC